MWDNVCRKSLMNKPSSSENHHLPIVSISSGPSVAGAFPSMLWAKCREAPQTVTLLCYCPIFVFCLLLKSDKRSVFSVAPWILQGFCNIVKHGVFEHFLMNYCTYLNEKHLAHVSHWLCVCFDTDLDSDEAFLFHFLVWLSWPGVLSVLCNTLFKAFQQIDSMQCIYTMTTAKYTEQIAAFQWDSDIRTIVYKKTLTSLTLPTWMLLQSRRFGSESEHIRTVYPVSSCGIPPCIQAYRSNIKNSGCFQDLMSNSRDWVPRWKTWEVKESKPRGSS